MVCKDPAAPSQGEISTKIAELAKRKEPQYPDGLDSDGLSVLTELRSSIAVSASSADMVGTTAPQ